jgi:ADP-heptose:LPS heptosyltransferase
VSGAANFLFSSVRPPRGYKKPATMIRRILDLIEVASGKTVEERIAPLYDSASYARATGVLPDGAIYVGLVPGAGGRHKCRPRERFVEIVKRQASRGRVPVVIMGPDEAPWYDELKAALPGARFPLREAAARMAAAVSNDSGGGRSSPGLLDIPDRGPKTGRAESTFWTPGIAPRRSAAPTWRLLNDCVAAAA